MRSASAAKPGSQRGTVTAEFVVSLPAVLIVFALVIQIASVMLLQQQLNHHTQQVVRTYQTSGQSAAHRLLNEQYPNAVSTMSAHTGLHCVHVSLPTRVFAIQELSLTAKSCVAL